MDGQERTEGNENGQKGAEHDGMGRKRTAGEGTRLDRMVTSNNYF